MAEIAAPRAASNSASDCWALSPSVSARLNEAMILSEKASTPAELRAHLAERRSGDHPLNARSISQTLSAIRAFHGFLDRRCATPAPQLALVSAGHQNRFGHPKRDVVQRWQAAGAEVLSTAESGAIRVWLGAQGLQLREQRIHAARWWDAAGRARSAAILSPIEQAAVGPEG